MPGLALIKPLTVKSVANKPYMHKYRATFIFTITLANVDQFQ